MILWWIGNIVLLLVIAPVVVYLLRGVLDAAKSIVPKVERIAQVAGSASRDLDGVELLHTTQRDIRETIATVETYGGSLDVILDDA